MIVRSTRLILLADILSLLSSVFSSLIGARALGPAGRGDLLIVVLWPPVFAVFAGLGLPTAYRYWIAKEPERASALFSHAIIYTAVVGVLTIGIADLIVSHLVGHRRGLFAGAGLPCARLSGLSLWLLLGCSHPII